MSKHIHIRRDNIYTILVPEYSAQSNAAAKHCSGDHDDDDDMLVEINLNALFCKT